MENRNFKVEASFSKWYYDLNNEEKIPYEIYSYWDEDGNLSKLVERLEINNVNIGESIMFDLDLKSFDITRDLVEDFKTNLFKVIDVQHDFVQNDQKISRYKCYELEPVFK
ncbi:hypothetical protein [Chryseobacterium sp. 5_R23647]|uniref:hypothetical protein n=1 Tax=Chryseobacterium sp. 5_R23647 TaxID=2258964 RepID=UPI000E247CAF|nr:hypothetical protein [Chryseobacterium sp. 5_R23647]REC40492.1 hypothetical protein DRF69_18535 [Chryseobacterium sp. 5_R23647]